MVSVARGREDFNADAESTDVKVSASSLAPEVVRRRLATGVAVDNDWDAIAFELRTALGESGYEAGRFEPVEG